MKKVLKQVGVFRNTEKGYGFIDFEDENLESVFVAPKMTKDALNGDKVEFTIIVPSRRTGERLKQRF